MSLYHATHPSPYDEACPDCTGYPEPDPAVVARRRSGWIAAALFLALALLAGLYIVTGGTR